VSRPALKWNVGGVLVIEAAEPGVVSAPSVQVYDLRGEPVGAPLTPTVEGSRLRVTVPGASVTERGQYRAAWSYTVGGVEYDRQQLFDVVRSVLRPTLTQEGLLMRYGLLAGTRSRMTLSAAIEAAWGDVFDAIESGGSKPNLIIDPRPLEAAHAAMAAWRYALNLSSGSQQSGDDWQAWASERLAEGRQMLADALRHVDWYDANDDLIPDEPEREANRSQRLLSR